MMEFKRCLDQAIIRFRKARRTTENIEILHDIINLLVSKDLESHKLFRIGIDEFYLLWCNAQ